MNFLERYAILNKLNENVNGNNMKSYTQHLVEAIVSSFNDSKNLGKEELRSLIGSHKLTDEHVKGILENPHLSSVDGLRGLANRSSSLDGKSLGLLTMHSMKEPDKYQRSQLAYQLVNSGKLNDVNLKHIASHALGPVSNEAEFDEHLAKKIHAGAENKEAMASHITSIRSKYK